MRELEDLERALAGRALAAADVEQHLHRDFIEFGKSGRVWTRNDVVASVVGDPPARVAIRDLEIVLLSEDIALVTYRSMPDDDAPALRSSIWVFEDGRWQMRFHHGTVVGGEPGSA